MNNYGVQETFTLSEIFTQNIQNIIFLLKIKCLTGWHEYCLRVISVYMINLGFDMRMSIVSVFLYILLAASNAIASPKLLYQFHTTNTECYSPSSGICSDYNEMYKTIFNQMSIELNLIALRNKYSNIYYDTLTRAGIYTFEKDEGISELRIGVSSPDILISLDKQFYELMAIHNIPSFISASLQIAGQYLQGGITLYDGSAEMVMNSGGVGVHSFPFNNPNVPESIHSLPISANEWGGIIRGDRFADHVIGFTGIWRISRAVPEPPSILLIALALAAIRVFTKRRRLS
jgi:hypothetical protein